MLNSELIELLQAQPQDLEVDVSVPVSDGDWSGEETMGAHLVYIDPVSGRVVITAS